MNPPHSSQFSPTSWHHIRERFNRRAVYYDNPFTAYAGELELRQIRSFVPPNSAVLDFGCGTGRTTLDLLRRGCRVKAFDISMEMLRRAESKARKAGYSEARVSFTANEDDLVGERWPLVVCIGVMDYYPDPRFMLERLKNYQADSGKVVVTFPNAASPLGRMYGALSHFTVKATPQDPDYICGLVQKMGWQVAGMRFAIPAIHNFGHTLVLALE